MEKDNNDYWNAQIACINALTVIGIHYKLTDRIPPMLMLKKMRDFWMGPTASESLLKNAYIEAEKAVNHLVELRLRGLEPPHKKDLYV